MFELLASTLRLSTPLLFAATGGILCERSGIATICLEGVMIGGAWAAAAVNYWTHSPWLGLLAGAMGGVLFMALHAFLCITARADQIVSGVAVNIFAAGITPLLSKVFFGSPTNTASIPMSERFHAWVVPLLGQIPGLGPLFFDQMPLAYFALALPFLVHAWLYRTRGGEHVWAAGDGPDALRTAGVSLERVRYRALFTGGIIASLGGVYLATSHASQFTRDMTAGRGYIALTALIFGKWKPIPTFFACLLFGLADAAQIQLQSVSFFGISFPVQFIQAIPYLATLFVLVGFIGKARPPLAIGTAVTPNE
jgi:simple sugar transport system permease protein